MTDFLREFNDPMPALIAECDQNLEMAKLAVKSTAAIYKELVAS